MKTPKRPWTTLEKGMLVAILVLIVIMSIKSLFFDAMTGKTPEEEAYLSKAQSVMSLEATDFWHKNKLVVHRIVALKKLSDQEVKEQTAAGNTTSITYKARIRSYFLWIIPFNEKYRIFNDQERNAP